MSSNEAPERIWLYDPIVSGVAENDKLGGVEYVRADVTRIPEPAWLDMAGTLIAAVIVVEESADMFPRQWRDGFLRQAREALNRSEHTRNALAEAEERHLHRTRSDSTRRPSSITSRFSPAEDTATPARESHTT